MVCYYIVLNLYKDPVTRLSVLYQNAGLEPVLQYGHNVENS